MSTDYPESDSVFNSADFSDSSLSAEIDPLLERMNAFWEEFIAAPYEVQWVMVTDMLAEEPELCDGEMVLEITNTLFRQTLDAGEIGRFSQLLDQLAETVPAAYEKELLHILERGIEIALIEGDDAEVEQYFYRFSPLAGEDLDGYFKIVSALDYHGKDEILYEGMRQARPYVTKSEKLVEWAYGEFTENLGGLEIIHLLAKNPNLMSDDPILQ